MKQIILIFLAISAISAQLTDEEVLDNYLSNFRVPRSKNVSEHVLRNHHRIKEHKKRFKEGLETFDQGLNEFSQLSYEEFARNKLGALEDDPKEKRKVVSFNSTIGRNGKAVTPPESFRWPDAIVGKVKNQGNCG